MRHGSHAIARAVAALILPVIAAASFAACGDPGPRDGRGYTKAPLERPGYIVRGEQRAAVAAFGQPNVTRADPIDLPEEAPVTAEPAVAVALPAGVTQAMFDAGQELFQGAGNCFSCHGSNAEGGALGPNLRDGEWLHIDGSMDALAQVIVEGVPQPAQFPAPMPAMGGARLTDEQVQQIAAYIYTLNP
jgi:mono/diheme cytochrome c family protein